MRFIIYFATFFYNPSKRLSVSTFFNTLCHGPRNVITKYFYVLFCEVHTKDEIYQIIIIILSMPRRLVGYLNFNMLKK